ncbi:hypothetical protein FISHEDRAFT_51239, partial [Fistulina hepatica ATCC 64428]
DSVTFKDLHKPNGHELNAFDWARKSIQHAILRSRRRWNMYHPSVWARACGLSDTDVTEFSTHHDVICVRSGKVKGGYLIFGKIRLCAIHDEQGYGYIHVR